MWFLLLTLYMTLQSCRKNVGVQVGGRRAVRGWEELNVLPLDTLLYNLISDAPSGREGGREASMEGDGVARGRWKRAAKEGDEGRRVGEKVGWGQKEKGDRRCGRERRNEVDKGEEGG